MLLTLKDIQDLTGYGSVMTGYQMLRAAGVNPVAYEQIEGRGAPVNKYREEDVLPVFAARLSKIRKQGS